jgi:hypothetical protein
VDRTGEQIIQGHLAVRQVHERRDRICTVYFDVYEQAGEKVEMSKMKEENLSKPIQLNQMINSLHCRTKILQKYGMKQTWYHTLKKNKKISCTKQKTRNINIFHSHSGPEFKSASNRNEYPESSWSKVRPVRHVENLTAI